jgi:hypothetical protein
VASILLLLTLALLCLGTSASLFGQSYSLYPFPVLGAGGIVSNRLYTIQGSIGQCEATTRPLTGGSYSLTGGYWMPLDIFLPDEYVSVGLGSTNILRGQTISVPINLASSDGVTNLVVNLQWPSNYFTIPQLTVTDPSNATGSLQDEGTNLAIVIATLPGQVFQNVQQIAQLSFSETAEQLHSAFVALPITSIAANKPNGCSYTNYVVQNGTIAVVEDVPLLTATLSGGQTRTLELYGWLGTNYQVQYSTNLAIPDSWSPFYNYVQTNEVITVDVDPTIPGIYYRLAQP